MNLKALRLAAKHTQTSLGEAIGMNKQQVYNYETGRSPVPLKYATKLAKELGVSKDKLVAFLLKLKVNRLSKDVR